MLWNRNKTEIEKCILELKSVQKELGILLGKLYCIENFSGFDLGIDIVEFADKIVYICEGRCSPDKLFYSDNEKLKEFANYLLSVCNDGEEFLKLKNSISQLEREEKELKIKLGIQ